MNVIITGAEFLTTLNHNPKGTKWQVICPACAGPIYFPLANTGTTVRKCEVCNTRWDISHLGKQYTAANLTVQIPGPSFQIVKTEGGSGEVDVQAVAREVLKEVGPAIDKEIDKEISKGFAALIGPVVEIVDGKIDALDQKIVAQQGATEAWVRGEIEKVRPRPIEITFEVAEPREAKSTEGPKHKYFDRLLFKVSSAAKKKNLFLVGPAGTGKTTLAVQVAEALGLNPYVVSCTEGLTETHVAGRPTAEGGWKDSAILETFENGGCLILDEFDGIDQNFGLVFNAAVEQGVISVPLREHAPIAKRHPDTVVILTANTYGSGGDLTYAGRNQQDGALLSRFAGKALFVDYDPALEEAFAKAGGLEGLLNTYWAVQKNVKDYRIEQPFTPRGLINCGEERQAAVRADLDWTTLCDFELSYESIVHQWTFGWSEEEREKALTGVVIPVDPRDPGAKKGSESHEVEVTSAREEDATQGTPDCPKCGSPTKLRRNHASHRYFWGCSKWNRNGTGCKGSVRHEG